MPAWRVARSLTTLREQVDAIAPLRSRASDGTIGDADHAASTSDHNPRLVAGLGATPVVLAADLTHDPARGADMTRFAEQLRGSRDHRIKYVIFNRRLFASYATATRPAWAWGPYYGDNPHDHHIHVSVLATLAADDARPWAITGGGAVSLTPTQSQALDNVHSWMHAFVTGATAGAWAHTNAIVPNMQAERILTALGSLQSSLASIATSLAALAPTTTTVYVGPADVAAIAEGVADELHERSAD